MDNPQHLRAAALCRCSRCSRDRLVLSSLSPRIARVLRLAIAAGR
ncbi:MAG TPA: hypothetical protein VKR80_01625 [Candidatus Limnocylindria bacterium]|nr:hypothetical protein [Candidatus Limnocylindria bacterium]